MSQESENVSDLFPADNIRENAESHHPEHHGNEIDCLGGKAYNISSRLLTKGPNYQMTRGLNY